MSTPVPDAGVRAFNRAVAYVIDRLEGGGKIITDSGGLTKWGISKRAHPHVDIAALTREGAEEIYRRDYWNRIKGDLLPEPLALLVFDAAVNMGPVVAVQMLQRIVRVSDDGVLGKETLLAVRGFSPQSELRARYNELRLRTYYDLAARKPFHKPSLYGWSCRVMRVADEAGRLESSVA